METMLGFVLALLSALAFSFCFSNAKQIGKFSSLLQVLETATNFMKWIELFRISVNVTAKFDSHLKTIVFIFKIQNLY